MPRILHLGFGNFHRAHQAWYTELANRRAEAAAPWRITGVSMRRPDLRDALAPEGFAYTLAIRGRDGLDLERVTVHDEILVAAEDPEAVLRRIADPETRIVTLTVTEKGYHLDPRDGTLDLADPRIRADLEAERPQSAVGLLAHGLARRAGSGAGGLTVISCDNISGNGRKLRAAVARFAQAAGLEIGGTAGDRVTFPDTMVDRITPATTEELRASVAAATGRPEAAPVPTETFSEWIVEDDFASDRPAWDRVGAEIVADVAPFEARKLRLLNASHSFLAYAGLLAGHRYVQDAIADPALRAGVERLFDEAGATLAEEIRDTLPAYRAALLARFDVVEMKHELAQIAMDGSQKVPVRLLPIVRALRQRGLPAPQATTAIASWVAWLVRAAEKGRPVHDPAADGLLKIAGSRTGTPALCRALLEQVTQEPLPEDWIADLAGRTDRILEGKA
ncbi:mannitol dehydrogenase family protein [Limimaricola pyoseonensis]|uniref:Fructuronate reductase n=1 Tax=Limimaricola pyoseonensis TaxID=521013 RepID=A0A1G7EXV9_9RHOB|nr:mannitol dehydrogenase family protein [Limimaricola pyoseonensis]SDE68509.1 fructuronate reductase [Limimaricola pyoseonensis]